MSEFFRIDQPYTLTPSRPHIAKGGNQSSELGNRAGVGKTEKVCKSEGRCVREGVREREMRHCA